MSTAAAFLSRCHIYFCVIIYAVAVTTLREICSPSLCSQVGDARRSTLASLTLMEKYGIYVQDINYPTVARGQEKLRIAPSPFHTPKMQEHFVDSLVNIWNELELPFTKMEGECSYYTDYDRLNNLNLNLPIPALA